MPEKEPQFIVNDRRKFTAEGDLRQREEASAEAGSSPAPAPAAPVSAPPQEIRPAAVAQETAAQDQESGESETLPDVTAEESADQTRAYQASSRQLDDIVRHANPAQAAEPQMSFDRLVQSIYMTAAMQMGAGAAPNEQPRVDIIGARQSIDMLSVLESKTKGNLTEDERRMLQNALFDLRMSFVELTNAIASSAKRPAEPGVIRRP